MSVMRVVGRMLRNVRGHDRYLAWNDPVLRRSPDSIRLSSAAFAADGPMPSRHAARPIGENVSPPLTLANVPPTAVELALIVQDPDAPLPRPFVHLVAAGIAPDRGEIGEGMLCSGANGSIRLGRGSMGHVGYLGPRPPPGHGLHRYVFQIAALDAPLALPQRLSLQTLLPAMHGHVLARGRLIGTFEVG